MQAKDLISERLYIIKFVMALFLLLLVLTYTGMYAIQNYYSKSILTFSEENKKIYILKSDTLKLMYKNKGMDYNSYEKRIDYLKELSDDFGYTSEEINYRKLNSIAKGSILFVIDMMALSKLEIDDIELFVNNGGKILFNFTSGFLNESLNYQKDNLVRKITHLNLCGWHDTIRFKKKNNLFLSTRLLSPVTQYLSEGYGLSIPLYDALPIFYTDQKADAYLTNWAQTGHPYFEKKELIPKESGLIWHGVKGKGKWVYFSFPSYVFSEKGDENYKKLFHGMLSYLKDKITLQLYPYIDTKNGVFVSEDTEYKYENLNNFQALAKKNNFPVTAFCVANLAKDHKKLMETTGDNSLVEIASHSYMHKKIVNESNKVYTLETRGSKKLLNRFSKQDVIGFRPPREEVDSKLLDYLEDANYKYILGASDNRIYPYYKNGILIIPRHATDDYLFLVDLDLSSNDIYSKMKKELEIVTNLDGIYTLSIHTHLMMFGDNAKVVDSFLGYVKRKKNMKALNGRMIYDRVSKYEKINTESKIRSKNMLLTISNLNTEEVRDVHYDISVDPSVDIINVESEFVGFETELIKKKNGNYILIIPLLQKSSQITLYLNYVQNS